MTSFGHLTLIMSLHDLVKCRSRSLAFYNKKFMHWLAHALAQKVTEITKSLKMCNLFSTNRIYFKTVYRRSK